MKFLKFRTAMILLSFVLSTILIVVVVIVLPPDEVAEKVNNEITPKIISTVQEGLNNIGKQAVENLSDSLQMVKTPKIKGVARALLGRENPFEPLSVVPEQVETAPPDPREEIAMPGVFSSLQYGKEQMVRNAETPKPQRVPPKLELKGIILGVPSVAMILVDGSMKILTEGESVDGLLVRSIQRDHVILVFDGEEIDLEMKEFDTHGG